ncbi:hypothetical protein [Streptomyces sp. LN699]|uniref:hypothetical protein n=1 Tax=Streptomyces sp. LN699 TaxID=3112981 RepID=UPI0037135A34
MDDLKGRVEQTTFRSQGDSTGDGTAELAAVWPNGTLHRYPGDKAKGLAGTAAPAGRRCSSPPDPRLSHAAAVR